MLQCDNVGTLRAVTTTRVPCCLNLASPTPTPTDDATRRAGPMARIAPSRLVHDFMPCMASPNPSWAWNPEIYPPPRSPRTSQKFRRMTRPKDDVCFAIHSEPPHAVSFSCCNSHFDVAMSIHGHSCSVFPFHGSDPPCVRKLRSVRGASSPTPITQLRFTHNRGVQPHPNSLVNNTREWQRK